MIISPISIATQGVYSNNMNLALASKGYIDLDLLVADIEPSGGGAMWGHEQPKRNDDQKVIMAVVKEFLRMVNE